MLPTKIVKAIIPTIQHELLKLCLRAVLDVEPLKPMDRTDLLHRCSESSTSNDWTERSAAEIVKAAVDAREELGE